MLCCVLTSSFYILPVLSLNETWPEPVQQPSQHAPPLASGLLGRNPPRQHRCLVFGFQLYQWFLQPEVHGTLFSSNASVRLPFQAPQQTKQSFCTASGLGNHGRQTAMEDISLNSIQYIAFHFIQTAHK